MVSYGNVKLNVNNIQAKHIKGHRCVNRHHQFVFWAAMLKAQACKNSQYLSSLTCVYIPSVNIVHAHIILFSSTWTGVLLMIVQKMPIQFYLTASAFIWCFLVPLDSMSDQHWHKQKTTNHDIVLATNAPMRLTLSTHRNACKGKQQNTHTVDTERSQTKTTLRSRQQLGLTT